MSKNFIEYSTHLFDVIVEDTVLDTKTKMRIGKDPDPSIFQKEVLDFKDIRVECLDYVLPGVKLAGISLREQQLLLLTGIIEKLPDNIVEQIENHGINLIQPHTGHLLALVKDAKLTRNENHESGFYEENIFSQQDDTSYNGHSLADLKLCIEPFLLFEVGQDSLVYCMEHRDVGKVVCSFIPTFFVLPVNALAQSFQDLLITGGPYLRRENVFNSLTSAHWRHSFLELYRCLEALYSLPRALNLKKKLNLTATGVSVAKACYAELGWKRKEEDSIKKLFKLLPDSIALSTGIVNITIFSSYIFDFTSLDNTNDSYEKLGEYVYKVRNSLVHHLEVEEEFIPQSDSDWVLMISFLISAVKSIYSTYECELR